MSTENHGPLAHNNETIPLDGFRAPESDANETKASSLRVMNIGRNPAYVSFFLRNGPRITAHFLDPSSNWAGGYVECLGDDCPACEAGLQSDRFVLLPVVDRVTAKIALLRIPSVQGPGKLATELTKVLSQPDLDKVIAKISKAGNYSYHVDVLHDGKHDPEAVQAVRRYADQCDQGLVDLTIGYTRLDANEMASSSCIAKILQLEGL